MSLSDKYNADAIRYLTNLIKDGKPNERTNLNEEDIINELYQKHIDLFLSKPYGFRKGDAVQYNSFGNKIKPKTNK